LSCRYLPGYLKDGGSKFPQYG